MAKEFLTTYLVPNYYLKEHLCEDYTDERWERFKNFVGNWACRGEMDEIMNELKVNFEKEEEEEEDDEEEEDEEEEN
jgi:hypothetical protein